MGELSVAPHTWAFMLSTAAITPEDLEGLFFGHDPMHVCSFRLLGSAGSGTDKATAVLSQFAQELVAEQMRKGFRLLGWCNLRSAPFDELSLNSEERRLHQAVKTASDALAGADAPFAGCLVLRPPRDKNDKGKFQQSAVAFGTSLQRVPLKVRHLSTQTSPSAEQVNGELKELMAACTADLRDDVTDLDTIVCKALAECERTEQKILPQVKRLRAAQHAAWSEKSTQRA
ncbi:unnamed protein product [Symbiodinium natans]|uniref:Uncharacterized protein n=1 Tax=Symbiodinium natans TaxID=878477 RepID=A0A812T593_9DINO|nr:unnamed protein product [Symbiodinium natans]